MEWSYYQKTPRHWKSSFPHGYFIVQEEKDDGEKEYVVYQGDIGDWQGIIGDPSIRMGGFETVAEAKKFTPP